MAISIANVGSTVIVAMIIICVITDVMIKRFKIVWLPESVAAMSIGALVCFPECSSHNFHYTQTVTMFLVFFFFSPFITCWLSAFSRVQVAIVARIIGSQALSDLSNFDADLFFFVLLPPIIFDAGYTLKKRSFFNNLGSILSYAFIGTLISTLVIGFGLFGLNRVGWLKTVTDPNIYEFLMFASLISATDPVATLNIFSSPSVDAPPLLYSLVFGESVLNDAVAIGATFHVFVDSIFFLHSHSQLLNIFS
jgi:NhaP-type Na+/H+ or K+/H+ antiporter